MSRAPGSPATHNSPDATGADRDQAPNSAMRAHDVAERAEEAAQRPLAGGDAPAEPLTSGDNLQPSGVKPDAEERLRRTAERAYFKAERRGFAPGQEEADWFEAERESDRE